MIIRGAQKQQKCTNLQNREMPQVNKHMAAKMCTNYFLLSVGVNFMPSFKF